MVSTNAQTVRAACISMELIGWFVTVPLSMAALVTGIVQAVGTNWGLLRQWWVVAKLVLTVIAVAVLWRHMQQVSALALLAGQGTAVSDRIRPEVVHSAGGFAVLFVVMLLSVFKPWGPTPYGRRYARKADSIEPETARTIVPPSLPKWCKLDTDCFVPRCCIGDLVRRLSRERVAPSRTPLRASAAL
jgi:hypothetical protein